MRSFLVYEMPVQEFISCLHYSFISSYLSIRKIIGGKVKEALRDLFTPLRCVQNDSVQ